MNPSGDLQQPAMGNATQNEGGNDGSAACISTQPRSRTPSEPSFPEHLEGIRSKLIGILAETFNGTIPGPKPISQFDSWILIFGENPVHTGQVINSVLNDTRMRFPVLDTILTTRGVALLQQKWVSKGNPTKFIIHAQLPSSGKMVNSTFNQLVNFMESKKRSWTERIYIIISTTMPAEAMSNGFATRFQKYLYVPSPTETANLYWFANVNKCLDTLDLPVNEEDRLVRQSPDEDKQGCLASVLNVPFSCMFFCCGE
ncbi:unnamed protein product [Orchesella dallaii]|uniref:Uncharacterized protein n=1 Tax=Orchesella dallaii TaxID=48710 RepID=A0ABP1QEY2_9HEXA